MLQLNDEGPGVTLVRREAYSPPAYLIDTVDLTFDLDATKTRVLNRMTLRRNTGVAAQPLKLDGEDLNLARVLVNGQGTSFKMEGSSWFWKTCLTARPPSIWKSSLLACPSKTPN